MAGVREKGLGAAIDRLYEAAARPELWRAVLHEISIAFGAEGATLVPLNIPDLPPVVSEGLDELAAEFIKGGWHLNNARGERGLALGGVGVITESQLFTPDELDRHPMNSDLFNPLGFRWAAGGRAAVVDRGVIYFTVERLNRQGRFSRREVSGIEAALPHLRRALQITLHLGQTREEGMLEGLERMGCGGILLNRFGCVWRMNARAERALGNGLLMINGQLRAQDRATNAALQTLLGSVLHPGPAHEAAPIGGLALRRPEGAPLLLHAAPLVGSARGLFQSCKAVLMLVDPEEHREPGEALLRQAFGLTPSEAQVALGLARGRDLEAIAAERGVGMGTIRVQLRAVFAKTMLRRQSELTALLARMALVP